MSQTQQELRQASIRAVTGTTLDHDGDWMALFDAAGIAQGDFNGRMLAWINVNLTTAYVSLQQAMQALAVANGAFNFSSMGTFTASSIPASVITKNLLTAWNTQTTAGNTSTPTKTPLANGAELTAAGWFVDNVGKQIAVYDGTTSAISGFDFSNYEMFIRNASTNVTFTNCKFAWGTNAGNRIIDLGDVGTGGWVANWVNCLFDLQGQTAAVNGGLATNGDATTAGAGHWTDCRWVNAKYAYIEWSYGTATVLRNYFGPVATYGVLDDGGHCEHWHGGGGTTNITDSMFDQRWTGTIYNALTGLVAAGGDNSVDTINLTTSILIGTAAESGHPTTWVTQSDVPSTPPHNFNGFINATDCCIQKGTIGYGTPDSNFTPVRCLNIDTGATIINGTTP